MPRKTVIKGSANPISEFPFRSNDITTIVDAQVFNNVLTALDTISIDTHNARRFLLFLNIDSANTPTDIQFIPQFSDDVGVTWFDYKQGLFASLFYEDLDTAPGITECFSGECAGRLFRLRVVATGTTALNTFTVTARVSFLN